MSVTGQARSAQTRKLRRLVAAEKRSADDVLVGIYEAREAGLTLADIAYMVGGASQSTITAKADKGQKIAQERTRTT